MSDSEHTLAGLNGAAAFRDADQAIEVWVRLALSRRHAESFTAPLPPEWMSALSERRDDPGV